MNELLPVLEQIAQTGKPLAHYLRGRRGRSAGDAGGEQTAWHPALAPVKAPGFGDRRKDMLRDIAILTAGNVISDDLGIKLENITLEDLGRAKRVTIDKDNTPSSRAPGQPRTLRVG